MNRICIPGLSAVLVGFFVAACAQVEEPVEICWIEFDNWAGNKHGPLAQPEEVCAVIPVSRIPPRVRVVRIDGVEQPSGTAPTPGQPEAPQPEAPQRGPSAVSAGGGEASIVTPDRALSAGGGAASIVENETAPTGGDGGSSPVTQPTALSAGGGEASIVTPTKALSAAGGQASLVSLD